MANLLEHQSFNFEKKIMTNLSEQRKPVNCEGKRYQVQWECTLDLSLLVLTIFNKVKKNWSRFLMRAWIDLYEMKNSRGKSICSLQKQITRIYNRLLRRVRVQWQNP